MSHPCDSNVSNKYLDFRIERAQRLITFVIMEISIKYGKTGIAEFLWHSG